MPAYAISEPGISRIREQLHYPTSLSSQKGEVDLITASKLLMIVSKYKLVRCYDREKAA